MARLKLRICTDTFIHFHPLYNLAYNVFPTHFQFADVVELKIGQNGTVEDQGHTLQVAARQSAVALRDHLAGLKQHVIRLKYRVEGHAPLDRFLEEPLDGEDTQSRFMARISHIPAFWCCRMGTGEDRNEKPMGSPYAPMLLGDGVLLHLL